VAFLAFLAVILIIVVWLLSKQKQPDDQTIAGREPDYGLVRYGKRRKSQKNVAGVTNPYLDANKPTIIFIPG
jgi:hypothetical protein